MAKRVRVKFQPKTTLRVSYKAKVYHLVTEGENQFVDYLGEGQEGVGELLEHLKKIGIIFSYDLNVEEENGDKTKTLESPTKEISSEDVSAEEAKNINEESASETLSENEKELQGKEQVDEDQDQNKKAKKRKRKKNS